MIVRIKEKVCPNLGLMDALIQGTHILTFEFTARGGTLFLLFRFYSAIKFDMFSHGSTNKKNLYQLLYLKWKNDNLCALLYYELKKSQVWYWLFWHLEASLRTRFNREWKPTWGGKLTPMSDPEPIPKKTPSDRFCLTPATKRATKCWLPLPSTFPLPPLPAPCCQPRSGWRWPAVALNGPRPVQGLELETWHNSPVGVMKRRENGMGARLHIHRLGDSEGRGMERG